MDLVFIETTAMFFPFLLIISFFPWSLHPRAFYWCLGIKMENLIRGKVKHLGSLHFINSMEKKPLRNTVSSGKSIKGLVPSYNPVHIP